MSDVTYTCRNRRCKAKQVPGWMLGANPICPHCGRWLTKPDEPKPSVK